MQRRNQENQCVETVQLPFDVLLDFDLRLSTSRCSCGYIMSKIATRPTVWSLICRSSGPTEKWSVRTTTVSRPHRHRVELDLLGARLQSDIHVDVIQGFNAVFVDGVILKGFFFKNCSMPGSSVPARTDPLMLDQNNHSRIDCYRTSACFLAVATED